MSKVRLAGYLEVPPDRFDQVAAALPDHIALTRAEPGCIGFEVSHDPVAPDRFVVAEIFADQAAFEQHQGRVKASVWGRVTAGLNRRYTITTDATDAPEQAGPREFAVADTVRRRATAEGQPGLDWLASLDDVLTGLEQDWQLTIGPTLAGGTAAFVAEATTAMGDSVVLKVVTPASSVGRHEAEVLGHAAGRGYARLLQHDPSRSALLLERLGDRLETLDMPYERQVDIMCATLLHAWMPVPADFAGPTGADKANGLAQSILRLWASAGQPCAQPVIDRALMYCRDRAAAYRPQSAVFAHGDPHPGNTLVVPDTADPVQFKFIDPDGLAIEPAYDLGVLLRAWHDGIAGRHAHDIARAHARHLTTRTQVPSEAIWQWGYIERVSTGLHLLEIGQADKGRTYLGVAEAIAATAG
ncbi:MAG: antibiotic biosynthesis monooxygenase [Devosia sp.]